MEQPSFEDEEYLHDDEQELNEEIAKEMEFEFQTQTVYNLNGTYAKNWAFHITSKFQEPPTIYRVVSYIGKCKWFPFVHEIALDERKREVYIKFVMPKRKEYFTSPNKLGTFFQILGPLKDEYSKNSLRNKFSQLPTKFFHENWKAFCSRVEAKKLQNNLILSQSNSFSSSRRSSQISESSYHLNQPNQMELEDVEEISKNCPLKSVLKRNENADILAIKAFQLFLDNENFDFKDFVKKMTLDFPNDSRLIIDANLTFRALKNSLNM